jgi:colanic acid biosynthesis glycosyl transferase WcaI
MFQNWINTSSIHPMANKSQFRADLKISDNEIVLLYSGNFGEKQGLEIIIDAARVLQDHQYIRFIMCGDGASLARMLRLAEGLPNIQFLPLQPRERLNELLNLADIHLLPQRSDIADFVLPSKLTGIMASGRPVIATTHSGTELALTIKNCGLLVPPGDVEAFVRAITHLADNPTIRSEMGNQARSYAISHWGHDKVLGNFEKEILSLVGR